MGRFPSGEAQPLSELPVAVPLAEAPPPDALVAFILREYPGFVADATPAIGGIESRLPAPARAHAPITDADVLAYASSDYDKSRHVPLDFILGTVNNLPVIVEFRCSDLCPAYTVRIIHFGWPTGTACAEIGGAERTIMVPKGRAAHEEAFCFPKVLVENWDRYKR